MLSVRLPQNLERDLGALCERRGVTKTQVVQEALAEYLAFLAPDDPIRAFIGIARGGPSTDEWMAITRGEDWNKP